jgi:hypothetical protein
MDNETSAILASEMEPFAVNRDLPPAMRRTADLSRITRLAASADVDGEIIMISAALEFSGGNPIQHIFRAAFSAGSR